METLPPSTPGDVETALGQLEQAISRPRLLALPAARQEGLRQALQRARAQLMGPADAVLTIALAGNAGAGKSTLINALAGVPIARTSDVRPCTSQVKVYHHQAVPRGGLPPEVAAAAEFSAHNRPELRLKTIVDTPDLNTFKAENRARTRGLLKAAGLVVYVFTPEDYLDERLWSVVREEQRFTGCIAVVNKADRYPAAAVANAVEEFRARFRALGAPEISVLRVCAACHAPAAEGQVGPLPAGATDEFAALREFIESELQAGDLARRRAEQRGRILHHLQEEVEQLAPAKIQAGLEQLGAAVEEHAARAATALVQGLEAALPSLDAELEPIVALRLHRAFFGPFRLWLSAVDFLRYGLPRVLRSWRGGGDGPRLAELLLAGGDPGALTQPLRAAVRDLQNFCFQHGLPVEPWRQIEQEAAGSERAEKLARAIELRFETNATAAAQRHRRLVQTTSVLGWLLPVMLAPLAIWRLGWSLWTGTLASLDVLLAFFALCGFLFILLHAVVSVAVAGGRPFSRRGLAATVVQSETMEWLRRWAARYRVEVEAELRTLLEPLQALRAATGVAEVKALPASPAATPALPALEAPKEPPSPMVKPAEPVVAAAELPSAGNAFRRAMGLAAKPPAEGESH